MLTPSLGYSLPPAGPEPSPQPRPTWVAVFAAQMRSPGNLLFLILVIVSLIVFWTSLTTLVHYSLWGDNPYDKYSYTLAIPFISVVLVFAERRKIFARVEYGFWSGAFLLLTALILNWSGASALHRVGSDDSLSIRMLALVIFWLAGFILCYGVRAFWAGAFPLLFLLLTVPIPDLWLDKPITAVQYGSTEVCSLVFSLVGIPFIRNGLEFYLSTVTIQVAKECSGIHSTIAIFTISLIAGHLFLSSAWKKALLVLLALPIVCVTNGVRIAGLTLLSQYVDESFLHGNLHHRGGMFFFLLALLFLFGILRLLRTGKVLGPSG